MTSYLTRLVSAPASVQVMWQGGCMTSYLTRLVSAPASVQVMWQGGGV